VRLKADSVSLIRRWNFSVIFSLTVTAAHFRSLE
jgi:hypothetical protein